MGFDGFAFDFIDAPGPVKEFLETNGNLHRNVSKVSFRSLLSRFVHLSQARFGVHGPSLPPSLSLFLFLDPSSSTHSYSTLSRSPPPTNRKLLLSRLGLNKLSSTPVSPRFRSRSTSTTFRLSPRRPRRIVIAKKAYDTSSSLSFPSPP